MSKIIKTVLIIAVAVAVVVFAPQIAGVLAQLGGALGIGAGVATAALVSSVVGIGISLGLTAVAGLFRKSPSLSQSLGDRLNSSIVPTAPRRIVFGRTAAGNDCRYAEGELDLPNSSKDGYAQVIALASHKINAVISWYIDEELSWYGGVQGKYRDGINTLSFVNEGKQGVGFDLGTYWRRDTCPFTGCAYYGVVWKLDPEIFDQGVPTRLTTVVEGCPVYDPRRDSSTGGSGAHRADDQSTWEWRTTDNSEIGRNSALCMLTYLLGWRVNGKLMWGMGIPASRIDLDNFREFANICEERVVTIESGTVQRYTCDGVVSTSDTHETIINQITATMGSTKLTDVGGLYTLVGGYDDTMGPRASFDENDLVAPPGGATPFVWTPSPPLRECFNIARGRFANPAALYQLEEWGTIETDPLPDNIPRTMTIDLGLVNRAETCQRIAKQFLLREAKTPGVFAATFGPKAFTVAVGSLLTLSLPAQGWNNKLFRVMEQTENHDLLFTMTLREESEEVYGWDREEKPLPPSIRPQPYDPSTVLAVEGLACETEILQGANNVQVSQVTVTWWPELSSRVSAIQIESRPIGSTAWTEQSASTDPKLGEFTFTANAPGVTIDVRARYRMSNGIYGPWTLANIGTLPTETIDNEARDVAHEALESANGANDTIKQLPSLVLPLLQGPIDELAALQLGYGAGLTKSQQALHKQNLVAIQTLETRVDEDGTKTAESILQLTTRLDGHDTELGAVEAGLIEINRTVVDLGSAMSEEIDSKIANFGDAVSAWQNEEVRVRSEKDNALAEDIDQLGVRVDGVDTTLEGTFNDLRQLIVDGDGALGTRVDQMGVRITGETSAREAAIRTVEQAIVDGDKVQADRIDTLSSSIEGIPSDIAGIIQTIQETEATNNSARAAETTTLQSRLDNVNGASLEQTLTTFANKVDGVGASYVLKVQSDQNGQKYVAGMGIAVENGVSDVAFSTDSFRIVTPGENSEQVFYADANGVYMPNVRVDRISIGAMDGEFLNGQSINNPAQGYQVLPGGFTIQWGQWRQTSGGGLYHVVFPKPFTSILLAVTATPYVSYYNVPDQDAFVHLVGSNRTVNGFDVTIRSGPGGQSLNGFDWMAFGI